MTAVHVHPHEHPWDNHDIHIKQVRLCKTIATLVYHTFTLFVFPNTPEGDRGWTGPRGES